MARTGKPFQFRASKELLDALRELSDVTGRSMNAELRQALALHLTKSVLTVAQRDTGEAARLIAEQAAADLTDLERATYGDQVNAEELFSAYSASMN